MAIESVSMTAPVIVKQPSSEKIAMTAPVFQSEGENEMVMSFVLPAKYTFESAPKPKDPNVELVELPERRRLVYTFSGSFHASAIEEAKRALLNYAEANQILVLPSTVVSAGYNPPWTIPALRRNEVLVDIGQ